MNILEELTMKELRVLANKLGEAPPHMNPGVPSIEGVGDSREDLVRFVMKTCIIRQTTRTAMRSPTANNQDERFS